ncbi:MAG: xanthine dehydrogenase family protein molybdopterin-binding subunit [Desulfotomaculales bacterium]
MSKTVIANGAVETKNRFRQVGQRVPKMDAWEKVSGRTQYIHDLKLPNMLHAKILYSKYPHARIVHIDPSRAEKLPGVRAVITGYNTPEIKIGFLNDNPVLKKDKVRQYRDEVAAVAAVDPDIAAEALELIRVEYEELPAVFDPLEAMTKDAPLVHADKGTNVLDLPWQFCAGDVEAARANSAYVVEETYRLTWVTHCCLGTAGCVADFQPNGNLTVYTPTQIRFLAQRDFMRVFDALGLPRKKVNVVQVKAGGAFGSKLDTYPYEYITILLSYYTGRPVKLVFTREEEFFATPGRQPAIIKIAQGCTAGGQLTFRDVKMILDNGAYTSWGATTPTVMVMPVSSLYKVPNVRYEATCVYTNNIYCTAMRGYGNPQITFAIESQIDTLAEMAGIDPLEFRLINANTPGEVTPQKFQVTSCGLKECLETVRAKLGWDEKRGRGGGRGVGVAALLHVGGGARIYRSDGCGVILKIDDFGRVTVLTGATDMGQGSETVIAQIVAEELGVKVGDVTVVNNNTDTETWDVGAHASRTTFIAGNAALRAARRAKEKILVAAARVLKLDAADLYLEGGQIRSSSQPGVQLELARLLRQMHFASGGQVITADYFYDPNTEMLNRNMSGNLSAAYTYGAHGVEVEVDRETGQVKILNYICAIDAGRAINPMLLEGQLEGGVAMGIGYALTEELKLADGKVLNPNFLDYRLPTSLDAPKVQSVIVETADPEGPFGAKGIGAPPAVAAAPAIANAIYDAVGVRLRELPMTPERILAAIKNKDAASNFSR